MKYILPSFGGFLVVLFLIFGVGCPMNLGYIKAHAEARWHEIGYEVVGYEGHQWSYGLGPYGGARVWYQLRAIPDDGRRYSGFLMRWGDEPLQIYGPKAVDAARK